ncbi:arylsulfatase J-like [Glandiceps talaboti]
MANRRTLYVMLFVLFCISITRSSLQKPRPHIILIVADDLGWNDISFHGSDQIPTPNIDQLAHGGVILNNYYVQPICTPTRAALMTGRHPIHLGLQHGVINGAQPSGLPLNQTIFPQYLKTLGYNSHMIGKWHLGYFAWPYTPTYRGFESHFGYYNGKEDYYDHMTLENQLMGYDLRDGVNVTYSVDGQYTTEVFTSKAEQLIKQHNKDKPLFLYLAHLAVHSANPSNPLEAPDKYVNRFPHIQDKNRKMFAAMVSALDDSVGNITKTLKETGMYDNSVIIFTSDNGGPAAGFDYNHASNWPLRGLKDTLWEGGMRAAGFVHSPLLARSGIVLEDLVHVCDWLPTVYTVAGGNVTDLPANLDGYNVWETLSKGVPSPRTEILHNIDPISQIAALRVGNYKIILGESYKGEWDGWYKPEQVTQDQDTSLSVSQVSDFRRSVVHCGVKPSNASTNCQPAKTPCLFNIKNDPCEYNNVADKYPEILKDLLLRLDQYNMTAVPPWFPPNDPQANPNLHGGVWSPWITLK